MKFFAKIFMFYFQNDLFFLLPEVFFSVFIISFLLFGVYLTKVFRLLVVQSFFLLYVYTLFTLFIIYLFVPAYDFFLLNFQLVFDYSVLYFKLFAVPVFAAIVLVTANYFFFEKMYFVEYCFFSGLFLLSAFMLASVADFFLFYLFIELQSLVLYTLTAMKKHSSFSVEAGLKYFILGSFSSGLLLFGISFFYGLTGFLNFYDFRFFYLTAIGIDTFFGLQFALIFILAALMFKLSVAPFHIWVPDVYEGAPAPTVLLFVTLPKLVLFLLLYRLFIFILADFGVLWYNFLSFVGITSVV